MTFRFDNLLWGDMLVRDIRNRHPQTREVFARFGVRTPCWDCSLAEVAHRSDVSLEELLDALNEVLASGVPEGEEPREES